MPFTHAFVETPELLVDTAENGVRYYVTPDGNRYESVTTFIGRHWDKAFLNRWRARIGEAKAASESTRTKNRGTKLHKVVEHYLLNQDVELRKTLSEHVLTKTLFIQLKPLLNRISNIRLLERALWSDRLKLAGTPDCIADFDGALSIIDIKGSTRSKQEKWITTYWLQTAIYNTMFAERHGEMPSQSVIIMAVEDDPNPELFIEPAYKGLQRLEEFIEDPVKFQADLTRTNAKVANPPPK
jgi:genome maintenance exonuclease 1